MTMCEYVDVFVEPIPEFWTSFRHMVTRASNSLKELNNMNLESNSATSRISFLESFNYILSKLESASLKLSQRKTLTDDEMSFLKNIMEERGGSGASRYLGWYPKLFYSSRKDSGEWDPLVTDIHTDPSDDTVRDPGCVLHQGVGNVLMGLFSVNIGTKEEPIPKVFGGPVFSYYEFTTPIDQRWTDSRWRKVLRSEPESIPPYPTWATSNFLVPGENIMTKTYQHKDDT
jgi:Protein of unknown function (DUF3160)